MSSEHNNVDNPSNYKIGASFYGKDYCVHFDRDTIRALGCPRYIVIKVKKDMTSFIVLPAEAKEAMSFRVPQNLFEGNVKMRIHSQGFVVDMFEKNNWNINASYRVEGKFLPQNQVALFELKNAKCFNSSMH